MRRPKLGELLKDRDQEIKALRDGLLDLEIYVMSEKFHKDPTVQVSDVLLRVREIKAVVPERDEEAQTVEP